MTAVYTRRVSAQLRPDDDGAGGVGLVPVKVNLSWRRADPIAVQASFRVGRAKPVVWLLGLELLTAGLRDEVGCGDVMVGPRPDAVELRLSVCDDRVRMWFPRVDVELFLDAVDVLMGPIERDTAVAVAVDEAIVELLALGGAA